MQYESKDAFDTLTIKSYKLLLWRQHFDVIHRDHSRLKWSRIFLSIDLHTQNTSGVDLPLEIPFLFYKMGHLLFKLI